MDKYFMTPKMRLGTAIHEAAHAVAAVFLNVPFDLITIVPDKVNLGHIAYTLPKWAQFLDDAGNLTGGANPFSDRGLQEAWLLNRHISSLAGDLATDKFSDLEWPAAVPFSPDARAQTLVKRKWSHIEAVARELMRLETLSEESVKCIIAQLE